MGRYIRQRKAAILAGAGLILFIHIYFGYLVNTKVYTADLLYLDGILLGALLIYFVSDCRRLRLAQTKHSDMEKEILDMKKERDALRRELDEQSEYIAKWSHEVKLPLAALGLMALRSPDEELRDSMQDCLERIRQQLHTMLMSGKLKTLENDVVFRRTELADVVNEAVKSQSWLLIREHFQIEIDLCDVWVYSDKRWLSYILNQLIANAVKYKKGDLPCLRFGAEQVTEERVSLWVEDTGIGIREEDLPFIFDRGYIGGNLRDGDYRSTGMGLYFAREAAERLGIKLKVESRAGEWTRFTLDFHNNSEHFLMKDENADILQEC